MSSTLLQSRLPGRRTIEKGTPMSAVAHSETTASLFSRLPKASVSLPASARARDEALNEYVSAMCLDKSPEERAAALRARYSR